MTVRAGGATVRVASGAALVDGKIYESDANNDFAVNGVSVYWLVGLTKDHANQSIRAFCRGSYATDALALAALVQTNDVTWEIPLATVLTTAGGNVSTIYDKRRVAQSPLAGKVLIERKIVTVAGATIDFQNIPAVFKNLTVKGLTRGVYNADYCFPYVFFNNDSGANYWDQFKVITDTTVTSVGSTASQGIHIGHLSSLTALAGIFDVVNLEIPNYSSATYKALQFHAQTPDSGPLAEASLTFGGGFWKSTAVIDRITLTASGGGYAVGSELSLYGEY